MREISQSPVESLLTPPSHEAFTATIEMEILQDKCGVFGVIGPVGSDVATTTYDGLRALQHRGYDASGIALYTPETGFRVRQGVGTMKEVFANGAETVQALVKGARIGLGHDRYGTTGELSEYEAEMAAQPYVNEISSTHNGNVENAIEVAWGYGIHPSECPSDSIAVGKSVDMLVRRGLGLREAARKVALKLRGSFSLVLTDGEEIVALRDPNGNRPLSIGCLPNGGWVFASETVALDTVHALHLRDVEPGEIVSVHQDRLDDLKSLNYAPAKPALCGMEPAYTANKKSMLGGPEGRTVEDLRRLEMGYRLAEEHPFNPADDLVVIGVPSSGVPSAEGYAEALSLTYVPAIEKIKDERSFMFQGSEAERQAVTTSKLRIYPEMIQGNRLLIVDDSVARGNAGKALIGLLRQAGAKEVHLLSAFPQINHGCHLGVDTGKEEKLLARAQGGDLDKMRQYLDADSLRYISPKGYRQALEPTVGKICLGCVDGDYPVPRMP
jgi:amidophosphoribosyltransferase